MKRLAQVLGIHVVTSVLCVSSVAHVAAEIVLPPGFEAEVFVVGLTFPDDLDTDLEGSLYVGSGLGVSGPAPLYKIHPDGTVFASDPVPDPDGIAVADINVAFVTAGDYISVVEFPSGSVTPYAGGGGCFANLQSMDLDDSGQVYVGQMSYQGGPGVLFQVTPPCNVSVVATIPVTLAGVTGVLVDPAGEHIYYGGLDTEVFRLGTGSFSTGIEGVTDLARGPGGSFGEDLFVCQGNFDQLPFESAIKVVDSLGVVSPFALFTEQSESPGGIAFSGTERLYVSQPLLDRLLVIIPSGPTATESILWGNLKARMADAEGGLE